ncbi:MAG: hypothetical protein U5J83_10515 [Bryobacterales bacterium]|nr:hypothetical protein [Bryobacterales bacterium]
MRSVIFDIAETTVTVGRCCDCSLQMAATVRMLSGLPMLVPPNFMTSKFCTRSRFLSLPPPALPAAKLQARF